MSIYEDNLSNIKIVFEMKENENYNTLGMGFKKRDNGISFSQIEYFEYYWLNII